MVFKITAKGHELGLKLQYPYGVEKDYEIEVLKHGDPLKRSQSHSSSLTLHKRGSHVDYSQDASSVVSAGTIHSICSRTL